MIGAAAQRETLVGPEPAITMTRILPIHPIEMKTTFRHCFLANFSVQPDALVRRLPSHLHPDTHRGRAFVSVVIAEMSKMRPAFLPEALGVTYNQVVYRAVVKCGAERGVTFLRSDADSAVMVAGGNALTFFRFNSADVSWERSPNRIRFALSPKGPASARIEADYELATASENLPPSSVFSDLGTAQSFLTELYAAFGARRTDDPRAGAGAFCAHGADVLVPGPERAAPEGDMGSRRKRVAAGE